MRRYHGIGMDGVVSLKMHKCFFHHHPVCAEAKVAFHFSVFVADTFSRRG
jgi:hypothetical protein